MFTPEDSADVNSHLNHGPDVAKKHYVCIDKTAKAPKVRAHIRKLQRQFNQFGQPITNNDTEKEQPRLTDNETGGECPLLQLTVTQFQLTSTKLTSQSLFQAVGI